MKRYRNLPGIILLVISVILLSNEQIPAWIPLVALVLSSALLVWGARGNYYFSKAVKLFQSGGDGKKTLECFEKALKAGISDQYTVIAASVLLRANMSENAKEALEPITKGSNDKRAAEAKAVLSIYYWYHGDIDRAIELCESAKEGPGKRDKNIYVNLCTYYLSKGDIRSFRENLKAGIGIDDGSPAIIDFRAVSYILEGNYKAAGAIITDMLDKSTPAFSDPYIHLAMAYLFYGERDKAIDAIGRARDTVCHMTSIYKREDIEKLEAAIRDDWQVIPATEAILGNPLMFINGRLPDWERAAEPFTGMMLPETHGGLDLQEPPVLTIVEDVAEEPKDSDDVDTDLSESDEEWIRRHS